jgi:hypothetical protein
MLLELPIQLRKKLIVSDKTARIKKKDFQNKKTLRIASWNITFLNSKDQEIFMELKQHKIDICIISETKKKDKENYKLEDFLLI